ncbi:hypothetical protein O181_056296 [Austropuccinia psidii MF-1]|uniref:Uncharacterized protein n=1 Tax=Austropuccinia psidii MF-1 TaxID=1389203 RepID=A0A9Q3HST7_9BASI|nr:hypothetical protein [Austropuccinia psidii MF-1]
MDPKQADGNNSGQSALSPQASICSPPLLGHHTMVTSLFDWSEVIIPPMKDGNGKMTFELGPIVTMSCHPWYSNAKNKTHQIPPDKTHPLNVCLASKPHGNPLLAQVAPNEPSQHNEPPIPGWSPSSKPPEDFPTHEPEPEVAPTQSMDELFGKSQLHFFNSSPVFLTPPSPISSSSRYTPLDPPPIAAENPTTSSPLVPSSSHSYDDAFQEFTDLRPTLMIPRAINQTLLEHRHFLHIMPFVDATH